MKLTSDWHIHSRNSCDEASLLIADLVVEAAEAGIRQFGVTDHIHTPYNLPDMVASRADYLACDPAPSFHFGVELSVVSQWELDELRSSSYAQPTYGLRQGGPEGAAPALGVTAEDLDPLGVQYVIGGTHWPLYVPPERNAIIADYHRQNMFLATHPLVTIVAHPWWWMGYWRDDDGRYTTDPWLDDFGKIPQSIHDEFAAAVLEHGKVVEVNISATLLNRAYPETFGAQYLQYIAYLHSRGVRLSLGSDCHSAHYAPELEVVASMLEGIGVQEEELWRLEDRHV